LLLRRTPRDPRTAHRVLLAHHRRFHPIHRLRTRPARRTHRRHPRLRRFFQHVRRRPPHRPRLLPRGTPTRSRSGHPAQSRVLATSLRRRARRHRSLHAPRRPSRHHHRRHATVLRLPSALGPHRLLAPAQLHQGADGMARLPHVQPHRPTSRNHQPRADRRRTHPRRRPTGKTLP